MATTTFRSIFKVIQNSFPLRWVAWDRRFEVWGLGYFRLGFADLRLGAKNSGQVFAILVWASKNWRWGSRVLVRLPGFAADFAIETKTSRSSQKCFPPPLKLLDLNTFRTHFKIKKIIIQSASFG